VEYVFENVADVFGYTPDELESGEVPYTDLLLNEEVDQVAREVEENSDDSTERFSHEPYRVKTKDGEIRWVKDVTKVVRDDAGEITNYLGYLVDITERRESERELKRYERIVENLPVGVFRNTPGPDGEFVAMNATLPEIFDADSEKELLEYNVSDLYPDPDRRAEFSEQLENEGVVRDVELEQETLDGETIWISVTAMRTEEDGEVYFDGIVQDVTERKERTRELERTKERYRSLADNFPNGGVGVYDEDLRYTLVTGTMWDDIDPDASDLEGETIWDALQPETAEDVEPVFRGALAGETGSVVSRLGGRTYRVWATPLRDADGEIAGEQSFALDITEQLEREQRLQESDRGYRTLAEYFPNGIVTLFDHDLEYTLAAGRAFEDVPVEPDEVEGAHFEEVWGEESADALRPAFEAALDGEERSVEVAYEGREWVVHVVPITDERGDVFAGMTMALDITDRRGRERELEMFERVARTASDVIVTIDTDSVVRDVNPAVADVFGYEPGELVGEPLTALMPGDLVDDHLEAVEEYLRERLRHVDWEYVELAGVRADGSEIPLGISFTEYEHDDERFFTGIIRDISERKERERELVRQRTQLEDRERTLRRSYEIIADGDRSFAKKVDALVAVVSDAVDTDYGTLSRVNQGTGEYVFESIEAPADADIQEGDTVPLGTTNCERAISSGETLVLDNVETDAPELADRAGNADWGISAYLGAPVLVDGEPYGTFCFYEMEARTEPFSDWAVTLIDLLSNWVGYELERRQQADQLAALNSLNEVVREITGAVVEQPTRDAIEETVCEHLAAAESYEFAWIGEVDPATDSFEVRAKAGAADYLEEITISVDPDDERSRGPTATALRTGEIQTINDVETDLGLRALAGDRHTVRRGVVRGDPDRPRGDGLRRPERLRLQDERLRGQGADGRRTARRGRRPRHRGGRPQAGADERRGRRTPVPDSGRVRRARRRRNANRPYHARPGRPSRRRRVPRLRLRDGRRRRRRRGHRRCPLSLERGDVPRRGRGHDVRTPAQRATGAHDARLARRLRRGGRHRGRGLRHDAPAVAVRGQPTADRGGPGGLPGRGDDDPPAGHADRPDDRGDRPRPRRDPHRPPAHGAPRGLPRRVLRVAARHLGRGPRRVARRLGAHLPPASPEGREEGVRRTARRIRDGPGTGRRLTPRRPFRTLVSTVRVRAAGGFPGIPATALVSVPGHVRTRYGTRRRRPGTSGPLSPGPGSAASGGRSPRREPRGRQPPPGGC
jgi:PAS domain S-box-containing protein